MICHSNTMIISDEVNEIVYRMELIDSFYNFALGGGYVQQRNSFELLLQTATEDELIQLTSHANGVIRCYAFKGLLKTKSKITSEVIERLERDNAVIVYINGCVRGRQSVSRVVNDLQTKENHPTQQTVEYAHNFR